MAVHLYDNNVLMNGRNVLTLLHVNKIYKRNRKKNISILSVLHIAVETYTLKPHGINAPKGVGTVIKAVYQRFGIV